MSAEELNIDAAETFRPSPAAIHAKMRALQHYQSQTTALHGRTIIGESVLKRHTSAAHGTRAIAGAVDVESFDGLPSLAPTFFAETYTDLLPVHGDHPHVHAANLGVRLDAYDNAGGWGCLPRSDDRDLWTRLQQSGVTVESPSGLRVVGAGPFTIFAPTNDAFAKIDPTALKTAMADPKGALTNILTLHVIGGKAMAAAELLTAGSASSVQGGSLTFSGAGQDLSINGSAKVVCGDVKVGNGIVHIIDSVLMPS